MNIEPSRYRIYTIGGEESIAIRCLLSTQPPFLCLQKKRIARQISLTETLFYANINLIHHVYCRNLENNIPNIQTNMTSTNEHQNTNTKQDQKRFKQYTRSSNNLRQFISVINKAYVSAKDRRSWEQTLNSYVLIGSVVAVGAGILLITIPIYCKLVLNRFG